jgi:hypothetical protein
MLKKISSLHLLGILAALVLIYLGMEFFGGKTRSKSFREELVEIDTANVSKILIDSKGKVLELKKEQGAWKVGIDDGKFVRAQSSSIKNTLNSLEQIKPSRIVANNPSKWKEYQVDSAGTRVQVFEGKNTSLDLVIGRFGVQGQRSFFTYVRLYDENEIYAADNFMGISFGSEATDYRNQQILSITTDSLTEIRFNYPGDSAFALQKADSVWIIGSQPADSTSTADYLSDLRYVNSSDFVDDVPASALVSPTMSIMIRERNKPEITVKAFQHPVHQWIINSSLNPDSYFASQKVFSELFVPTGKLLEPPVE